MAMAARCAVIGALAILGAGQAHADSVSPLTELIDAAAQRLQIAEPVAAYKWKTHGAIEDPTRVQQELAELGADAAARNIDPDYVTRVFGDQIRATEAVEYSRFADWKRNPQTVPVAPPDLSASRSAIDALNQTMLTQLAANWDVLRSPACGVQLALARSGVVQVRQLDALYQQALSLATQTYCQQ